MTPSYFVSSAPPMDAEPDDFEESTFYPEDFCPNCGSQEDAVDSGRYCIACVAQIPQQALEIDDAINKLKYDRGGKE